MHGREHTVSDDTPRDYDRHYTKPLPGLLQIREGYDTDRGQVTRFFVQLEYRRAGAWEPVVRCDHDSEGSAEATHDVTEDGIHVDVYRDGEKAATEQVTGPQPATTAFDTAEDHLAKNLQRYVNRYERWHGINSDP